MCDLVSQVTPIARKDHWCDASLWFREGLLGYYPSCTGLTFGELREVVIARQEGWKILKGQRYIKQAVSDGGTLYTFKARPTIHQICIKYDIYPDC